MGSVHTLPAELLVLPLGHQILTPGQHPSKPASWLSCGSKDTQPYSPALLCPREGRQHPRYPENNMLDVNSDSFLP
jgi:hypothetical protein